jgi:hypothetical protein
LASTSALTRSGLVAAKKIAMGPASAVEARSAARSLPAASMTAATSSAKPSQGGRSSGGAGSEAPVPRRSNWITRENDASERRKYAAPGSSQRVSTWLKLPTASSRSGGPSPITW